MLFWGLAGFVDPDGHMDEDDHDKKEGLGADALANLAGVDEHDEFFKDNAIEVIKDHHKSQILMEIISEWGNHNVLASHGILLSCEQPDIKS